MLRLVILARKPGFRRAGIAHPARAEYPAGFFSDAQLEQLRAEPMLSIEEFEDEVSGLGGSAAEAKAREEAEAEAARLAAEARAREEAEAEAARLAAEAKAREEAATDPPPNKGKKKA